MSDLELNTQSFVPGNNLIDLTPDNENTSLIILQPPTLPPQLDEMLVCGRESIDNNPFDHAQKLADYFNDPFEIDKQTNVTIPLTTTVQVKTGDLIGIDCCGEQNNGEIEAENLSEKIENDFVDNFLSVSGTKSNLTVCSLSSIGSDNTPNAANIAFIDTNYTSDRTASIIENISPIPQGLDERPQRNNSDPNLIIKTEPVTPNKLHSISLDSRRCSNQLLKLSLTNSAQLANPSKRPLLDSVNDSFDDLNSTNPIWIDSESELDHDIEDLQCLKMKSDALVEVIESAADEKSDRQQIVERLQQHKIRLNESKLQREQSLTPPSLNSVKFEETTPEKKVVGECKNRPKENLPDILHKLKNVIDQMTSTSKQKTAHVLLESLSSVLNMDDTSPPRPSPPTTLVTPIVRQDTFDLEEATEIAVSPSPAEQNIDGIVEQLKHLVANQQVNVLQSQSNVSTESITTASSLQASGNTYIVVMNSSNVNQTDESYDSSPTYLKTRSQRSLSLHLPTKPSSVARAIQAKAAMRQRTNTIHTPVQSIDRRGSFSSNEKCLSKGTPITQQQQQPIRKSILKDTSFVQPTQLPPVAKINKLKLRVSGETTSRLNHIGPMKAVGPIKKLSTTIMESPINDGSNNHIKTSTPLPSCNVPSASSTPVINIIAPDNTPPPAVTPQKSLKIGGPTLIQRRNGTTPINRSRLSYMGSATPNPKRLSTPVSAATRRRSLSEFKQPEAVETPTKENLKKSIGSKNVSFLFNLIIFGLY